MKQNWEYKKLGEVCDVRDGTHDSPKYVEKSDYVLITSKNIVDGTISFEDINYISEADYININKRSKVDNGDILMPMIGTIGNPVIVKCDSNPKFCIKNVALIKFLTQSQVNNCYLLNYMKSPSFCYCLQKQNRGGTQKFVSLGTIRNLLIPVPPLSTQNAIVSELDTLSAIIADHKSLLKKYDELEQSIFYDMFGDPVKNDKGWEQNLLKKNVYEMFLGPFGSALKTDCYVEEGGYAMVYEQKHAIKGTLNLENHYITEEKFKSLERFEVLDGDFIMSCRGTIGRIFQIPKGSPKGIIHPSLMKIRIKEDYNNIFFKFMLSKIIANTTTNGNCVQMAITAKELGNMELVLPPLPLQQEFASKIEAIEAMKADTKKSLEKSEELFNARMDYYFNA